MDTKKLRQNILDLAIRGKLVPQDPNDEPASVLLQRIRAEKERLIKEEIRIDWRPAIQRPSDIRRHVGEQPFQLYDDGTAQTAKGLATTVQNAGCRT